MRSPATVITSFALGAATMFGATVAIPAVHGAIERENARTEARIETAKAASACPATVRVEHAWYGGSHHYWLSCPGEERRAHPIDF